jgi:hypothetical protein
MKRRGKAPRLIIAFAFLVAGGAEPGFTATGLSEADQPAKTENLQEIGKQLNNPVSSIWNITTQSNMTFLKGELSPAYRGQFTFNFQPVLPNLVKKPIFGS